MSEYSKPSDSISNYLTTEKAKLDEKLKTSKASQESSDIEIMHYLLELLDQFDDINVLPYVIEEPGDQYEQNDFVRANEYFPWYEAITTLLSQIRDYLNILDEEGQMNEWNEEFLREILHKQPLSKDDEEIEAPLKRMQNNKKRTYQNLQNKGVTSSILQDIREYIEYSRETKSDEDFTLYQATLVNILQTIGLSL